MTTLGDRLSSARGEAGLSQAALAQQAGVTQSAISDMETGKASGSVDMPAIAAILGVQPLWLAYGRGPRKHDGPVHLVKQDIPEDVLRLAEKLVLLPDEKIHAVSVLLGLKL
jgi:transcriptional regulator with XRE-family HTH domain